MLQCHTLTARKVWGIFFLLEVTSDLLQTCQGGKNRWSADDLNTMLNYQDGVRSTSIKTLLLRGWQGDGVWITSMTCRTITFASLVIDSMFLIN